MDERKRADSKRWRPYAPYGAALVLVLVMQQPLLLLIWLAAVAYRLTRPWVRTEHRRLCL